MIGSEVSLQVRGQTLVLHPERAVEWRERRTLVVADTHFGKSSIFRQHGLAVPAGADDGDQQRLWSLVRRVGAGRLVVLGDFLHGPLEPGGEDARRLEEWSRALWPVQIHVVAGNHDRRADRTWPPLARWQDTDLFDGPFQFTHDATTLPAASDYFTLSGHLHPVVRLSGVRKRAPHRAPRIPVFWRRENGLVLPSFGLFTGGCVVKPGHGEQVFAVGPLRVVPFAL